MEFISGGSLQHLIRSETPLAEEKIWKYFRQLISALEYCHDIAGIIHRDIKPENLLIDSQDNLKIVDFGVAFLINDGSDESKTTLGSSYFMAPEICKGGVYKGRQTDIWAAGVTLYNMVTQKLPFQAHNIPSLYKEIENTEPIYPPGLPPQLLNLLERMLDKDATHRITLPEIKLHSWITKQGSVPMPKCEGNKISITEEDQCRALATFSSAFAMAKIKMILSRRLRRIRERKKQKLY